MPCVIEATQGKERNNLNTSKHNSKSTLKVQSSVLIKQELVLFIILTSFFDTVTLDPVVKNGTRQKNTSQ